MPLFLNILKSRCPYPLRDIVCDAKRLADSLAAINDGSSEFGQNVIFGNGTIDTGEIDAHLEMLDVAARPNLVERLPVQGGPVPDRPHQTSNVHQVEPIGPMRPSAFHVLDVKSTIWWYPVALYGTDIYALHLDMRVSICEVDGPGSGAATNVEDLFDALNIHWREEELFPQELPEHDASPVKRFLLLLIFWAPVIVDVGVMGVVFASP